MNKKFDIPFSVPEINDQDKKAALETLESRWLTGGPKALQFENLFANYIGTKYAVSVNSCTAALHLSMRAMDISPGDEVLVPVLTFAATANAAIFCGAKPVFVDVDEKTFNISVEDMQKKISKRTKAVIAVHYGGQTCNMDELIEMTQDYHLQLVEDCAHAAGSTYKKQKAGSLGVAGCFSFYPTKTMTTLEGGMLTTNDKRFADRARLMRSHGMTKTAYDREKKYAWYYDVTELGYNYRMNEVEASIGISQLKKLDQMNEQRQEKAKYLTEKLSHIKGIIPPHEAENRNHIFHLYVIRVLADNFGINRDRLFEKLSKEGIGLSLHYTPLHLLSFYKSKYGYKKGDFPVAERLYNEILSLPVYPQISEEQLDFVIEQIASNAITGK